ncbi:MAG: hypothetical protein ABJB16_04305, partial [Saprospiraceae bacterium]
MKKYLLLFVSLVVPMFILSICFIRCTPSVVAEDSDPEIKGEDAVTAYAKKMLEEGRHTFRFETFGDEVYWTDALQLNKAIAGEKNGGV